MKVLNLHVFHPGDPVKEVPVLYCRRIRARKGNKSADLGPRFQPWHQDDIGTQSLLAGKGSLGNAAFWPRPRSRESTCLTQPKRQFDCVDSFIVTAEAGAQLGSLNVTVVAGLKPPVEIVKKLNADDPRTVNIIVLTLYPAFLSAPSIQILWGWCAAASESEW